MGINSSLAARAISSVATLADIGGEVIVLSLCFPWMAMGSAGTIKGLGFFGGDGMDGIDKFEVGAVGCLLVKIVGFVADGVADAAFHAMAVVIKDFGEGAFVNDGLVVFEAGALFAFVGFDGDGAELIAFDGLPRGGV